MSLTNALSNSSSDPNLCAIGLDVGGTKMAGGIVTSDGVVRHKQVIPTQPQRGGEAVLAEVLKLAEELLAYAATQGLQPAGIGVAVAELVDFEGNVTSAQTISWRGLPVREKFARLAPANVAADSRAAALGEARFGAGRTFKNFFYVTVGTGIGSCLVLDGQPYAGARGSAGTLASSPLTTVCTECGRVLKPVLEDFASGPALVARFNQNGPARATRGEEVTAAVTMGDPHAKQIVHSAGEALGVTIGWIVNVLDPEAVIIGGGLGLAGGLYWESFVASTRRHIWSDTNRDLPIVPAALGSDSALIGAAAGVLQKLERDPVHR